MKRVCVFCGSNDGATPAYREAARNLGQLLAEGGLDLVYGGADVGTMGEVANAALQAGGKVIGVIPQALVEKELAHTGLTELQVVSTMHERKASMVELADGFVSLPGGFGTLDELFEVVTWAQLGLHRKPCGILNVEGFFDGLIGYLDHAVDEGFVKAAHRALVLVAEAPERLLEQLRAYRPPRIGKWIGREEI